MELFGEWDEAPQKVCSSGLGLEWEILDSKWFFSLYGHASLVMPTPLAFSYNNNHDNPNNTVSF